MCALDFKAYYNDPTWLNIIIMFDVVRRTCAYLKSWEICFFLGAAEDVKEVNTKTTF